MELEKDFVMLPGWETVRCIGAGSSGKVYELRKKEEYGGDFHSALKVISIPATQEEYDEMKQSMSEFAMRAKLREQVEDISKEYRLMSVLKGHPNIVSCEDTMIIPHENDVGWDIYIRMELLTSLPDYVHEHGITGSEVIKLGSDICSALELCKQNGIIHRDIKPQNIFVSRYGEFKLGDFGVAKAENIKNTADKVGTYAYMAPEVFKNKPYNESVDIYSLGMVLYWLLNERRGPFLPLPPAVPTSDHNADAQLRRYRGEPLPPPKNGNSALKKVVLKACSYNSIDRYSSPADFKKALAMSVSGKIWREPENANDATVKTEEHPVRQAAAAVQPIRQQPAQAVRKPEPPTAKPATAPRTFVEENDDDDDGSGIKPGYIIALLLLLVAMATALVLYFGKSIDFDNLFKGHVIETAEPTESEEPEESFKVYSIILSSPTVTLTEGTTDNLTVTCLPEPEDRSQKPTYVWKSSDPEIAVVDQYGKIEGIKAGTATIMCYLEDDMKIYDECTVVVEEPVITKLEIDNLPDKTAYSMGEDLDTDGLVLKATYNNGDVEYISDSAYYEIECDMTGIGTKTVKVFYKTESVEFTVKISLF